MPSPVPNCNVKIPRGIKKKSGVANRGVTHAGSDAPRRSADRGVSIAGRSVREGSIPNRSVSLAGVVGIQGVKADGRVLSVGGQTKEGILSLRRIFIWIASIRWWIDPESVRGRRKRKAAER